MNFRVGQKVVCVDPQGSNPPLTKGHVYTVERVHPRGIAVREIPAPPFAGYFFRRFRPVVERKTDISFAHEILRKATKPAPATPVALHQGN